MTDKFQNKYRIKSHRMPQWDYSGNGIYFLTLVTQNRICNLGEIILTNGSQPHIQLSDFGKIVNDEWLKSFEMRNELYLEEYIIMPNHLHAIMVLDNTQINRLDDFDGTHGMDAVHVETHGRASLNPQPQPQPQQSTNQSNLNRKPQSISSFVAGFKSAINSKIDDFIDDVELDIPKYNRKNHFFQPNYHDHIIRNSIEYQRIKEYIINNPLKWNDDKFNPMNKTTEQ
jgi:putative transposase